MFSILMKTWFLWLLLVGANVLATVTSPTIDQASPEIDHVKPLSETPLDHPPSPSDQQEEVKVSFARGRLQAQKVREMVPDMETQTEKEHPNEKLLKTTTAAVVPPRNESETASSNPNVRVQPAKIRRKRPHGNRRVFADRVFGKKYGQLSPKVVVNKLKHDLLNNFTQEVANVSENGGEDERSGRKRKMEFSELKGMADIQGQSEISGKRKRDLNVWKNLVGNRENKHIRKMEAAPEVAHVQKVEVDVNITESHANSTESDLEPPKKALLTYRQFVEKKLGKLSHVLKMEKFIAKAEDVEGGSGEIGCLPDDACDHESAPLEGNVLSVMAVP